MDLNVGVVGSGSWGTTVAALISRNAPVTLWARDAAVADEINRNHTNERYLPEASLPPRLVATADIEEAVAPKDVIVMGVPSHGFRAALESVREHIRPWVPIVSLSKGLEPGTRMRMTEIIDDVLPGHPSGVLTGPNLAGEVMAGSAAASVIAMDDDVIMRELQKIFHSGLFRCYTNPDVAGCELAGVLKNVIAIAAGLADGQGAGENTRAALLTRGLAEITRLGVALGGNALTFMGLAGMGDLVATCTSPRSRNRTVGYELGKGRTLEDITSNMFMVAEGVKSAPVVLELAEQHGVDMPIAEEVHSMIRGESNARRALRELLRTSAGAEWEPG